MNKIYKRFEESRMHARDIRRYKDNSLKGLYIFLKRNGIKNNKLKQEVTDSFIEHHYTEKEQIPLLKSSMRRKATQIQKVWDDFYTWFYNNREKWVITEK